MKSKVTRCKVPEKVDTPKHVQMTINTLCDTKILTDDK